jgi:hypothetical protein
VFLAYVKDRLGHHSISVTVDIYGHLTPEANREAVDRLDDFRYYEADINDKLADVSMSNND